MKRLVYLIVVVLIGSGLSGCRKFDLGAPSCAPYPACSGIQEAGVVARKITTSSPSASSAVCQLRLRPVVAYSRPAAGAAGQPRQPSSEYDRAPSAGKDWCRAVHQGAGYVLFWGSTTLYFTQYGDVAAGGAVMTPHATANSYCMIDFYEPKAQNLTAAGPFPQAYCNQIVPRYRLRPAPVTSSNGAQAEGKTDA